MINCKNVNVIEIINKKHLKSKTFKLFHNLTKFHHTEDKRKTL